MVASKITTTTKVIETLLSFLTISSINDCRASNDANLHHGELKGCKMRTN